MSNDETSLAASAMATSIAIAVERLRKPKPMNGDGSNHMLDLVLAEIDKVADSRTPSTCATAERGRLRAEAEADYLRGLDAEG